MINKKIVANNFSKSVKTYDKHAKVQKHMANNLLSYLPNENINSILEIGSGTGYFTNLLLKKYPNSKIDICDISSHMLEESKKKFSNKINKYILGDIETIKFNSKYDLIVSNATFQWFNHLEDTVLYLKTLINKNSKIIFSTFGEKTYWELTESFRRIHSQYEYSQNFKSKLYFENLEYKVEEEFYLEEYESLIKFLKNIKGVGATSAKTGKKIITKGLLEQVEKEYIKLCKGKVEVTNHLLYVIINK